MEKLAPLLKNLEKNIDRLAIVVFVGLLAAVGWIWQGEQSASIPQPAEVPATAMPAHLPNEVYDELMSTLAWEGQLYHARPIDDEHPFVEIIRYNIFTEREPPSEDEIISEVNRLLDTADSALSSARGLDNADRRKQELLERCVRSCDQVITVWTAFSGAQQTRAEELRSEAQGLLDEILGTSDGEVQ